MSEPTAAPFRSGLAVLIGRTNAGKSTLLNALAGAPVSIVTPRPQTTRHPVHGIVHRPEGQVVFVDTPGFFKTHKSALVDQLHQRAQEALKGIDVVVHVVDPTRDSGEENEMVNAVLAKVQLPKILCLSKLDIAHRPFRDAWLRLAPQYDAVVEVSGFTGTGTDELVSQLLSRMPEGPELYPAGQKTNTTLEFQAAELIREKVYLYTGEEVPYRTQVELDQIEEQVGEDGIPVVQVKAAIVTPNERYQRMLIGTGARKIKQIRLAAQRALRDRMGKKVSLDLDVIIDRKMES
jgi:GTP-binding protein Era